MNTMDLVELILLRDVMKERMEAIDDYTEKVFSYLSKQLPVPDFIKCDLEEYNWDKVNKRYTELSQEFMEPYTINNTPKGE